MPREFTPLKSLSDFQSRRDDGPTLPPAGRRFRGKSGGFRAEGAVLLAVRLRGGGLAILLAILAGAAIAAVARAVGALPAPGRRTAAARCLGVWDHFEDPEAEDAVGDLQIVVERVEEIGRRLEAVQR